MQNTSSGSCKIFTGERTPTTNSPFNNNSVTTININYTTTKSDPHNHSRNNNTNNTEHNYDNSQTNLYNTTTTGQILSQQQHQ